jgi:hypothetical protein
LCVVELLPRGLSTKFQAEEQVPDPVVRKVALRSSMLKCGACLEYGCERVSARTSTLCPTNRPTNFFAEWLEWPIVKTAPPTEMPPATRPSPSAGP